MCNDMKEESNFIECFLWTQQKEMIQLNQKIKVSELLIVTFSTYFYHFIAC